MKTLVILAAAVDVGQAFGAAMQPYIDAAVNALIVSLVGWVGYVFKEKLHVEIDAKHREALVAYLDRQAASLVAEGAVKLQGTKVDVKSDALAKAANLAIAHIPAALDHFGLTPEKISDMIVDALPKQASVAQAQAVALDVANPATPSTATRPDAAKGSV
jgi:hypothetical protein